LSTGRRGGKKRENQILIPAELPERKKEKEGDETYQPLLYSTRKVGKERGEKNVFQILFSQEKGPKWQRPITFLMPLPNETPLGGEGRTGKRKEKGPNRADQTD